MSVHMDGSRRTRWGVLALAGVTGVGLAIWHWAASTPTEPAPSAQVPVVGRAANVEQPASASLPVAQAMIEQQAAAVEEVKKNPVIAPIKGEVDEKPPFVSTMEWTMLKGVASQHPRPKEELTRMVNFLRFTKQLELWQDMPKPGDPAQRKVMATQLLKDLPERVTQGDMPLADAQKLQASLLEDVEPDPAQRAHRAEAELAKLALAEKNTPATP